MAFFIFIYYLHRVIVMFPVIKKLNYKGTISE